MAHPIRSLAVLALVSGCTPGDDPRFRGKVVVRPFGDHLPLSWELKANLDRPAELLVALEDGRGVRTLRFPEAASHKVPLLGLLPNDTVRVTVHAVDAHGEGVAEPLRFTTGRLPRRFPEVDLVAFDPDRVEPGVWLLPVELVSDDEVLAYVVGLDAAGQVIHAWSTPYEWGALHLDPDGTLLGLTKGSAFRLSLTGEVLTQWGRDRDGPRADTFHRVDLRSLNHEVVVRPGGGFWSISSEVTDVQDFPCDYAAPDQGCGPATIKDPHVVAIGPEGGVRAHWSMAARLDPTRVGYDALVDAGGSYDWGHANAVTPRPGGGVLVSLRHQDALAALDADGDLAWILGHHDGWPADLEPYLLDPVGEPFAWPWHQHGPTFDADGVLWMFDNGNWQASPYGYTSGDPVRSRVVGYRVDPDAGTVRQVAEHRLTATGPLYSRALGNAIALPLTGNVAGLFGMTTEQGGVSHASLGWGSRVVRLVQWTPEGEVASDLRLRSDRADEKLGWRTYRALHAPSLYPSGVETWEP